MCGILLIVMDNSISSHVLSFNGLGIAPRILDILEQLKFTVPTPIQHQSIAAGIEGKDIMGIAQTGTGKTLAYGIPLIQRLAAHSGEGLVVVPTRELALQVDETLHTIGRVLGLRTAVLIGGASMSRQVQLIKRRPHVVIVTPGRLLDHLKQRTVQLNGVKILVLDEADRMFDMGFWPQINEILKSVPRNRQTMLFSATMPRAIVNTAMAHMRLPVRVEVAPQGTPAEGVEHELFIVSQDAKLRLLEALLRGVRGSVLVFSRTKHGAKKICRILRNADFTAAEIHSNRTLSQRRAALEGFKRGSFRVLVATDIAARGIDVQGIEVVINYDLPNSAEDYVHRVGRTGRAGLVGKAISFAAPNEAMAIRTIERFMRKSITKKALPELPPPRSIPRDYAEARENRPRTATFQNRMSTRRASRRNDYSRSSQGRSRN